MVNEDYLELEDKIRNSIGWKALDRFDLLKQSIHTFELNYKELEKFLVILQDEKFASTLWHELHRKQLNNYHLDLVRLLHNYNAAVKSLVDHMRVYMNAYYIGTSFYNEYRKLVNEYFIDDELVQFVQDLRNLIMHKGMPPTILELNFMDGVGKSYMLIDYKMLNDFKRWNSKSKAYLKKTDHNINVLELIRSYHTKCVDFNEKFKNEFNEYHQGDLDQMWAMQDKIRTIVEERVGWIQP